MAPFAGIVAFDGGLGDARFEAIAGTAIAARQSRVAVRRVPNAVFVQSAEAPRGKMTPSLAESDDRFLFAADARLDNRAELGEALDIGPQELARISDGALIRRLYRHRGEAGIARCLGAFAFALWDANAGRLVLGRDCLGTRSLFFYRGRERVAFATALGALLALPDVPREIDEIVMANYLAINLGERCRTFYRGIERVPSRTLVAVDRTEIRHRVYWSPDFNGATSCRRLEDYVERARELFDQAVAAATADTPNVAISMSGGLDSTAIAATAARLGRAERITCCTLVPPPGLQIDVGPGCYVDERDHVEALLRMHPGLESRLFTDETPHPFERDPTRLFARTSTPILNAANLGGLTYIRDAVAASGHQVMLVGALGNFGLSWDGRFSLPTLLRNGQWGTFARDLAGLAVHQRRGLARTIGGEVVLRVGPQWMVRLTHRLRGRDLDSVARFSALNPAFIAEHDLTRQWLAQGFDTWRGLQFSRDPARLRAYYLLDHNQFARDNTAGTKRVFGFETRDPHGDRRLLEFLLQIPEPMYRRNGVPRSFARAVLADRLPPEILNERRRGRQGMAWFQRLSSRRQDIMDDIERLDASPLARRLIDVPKLKGLMAQWPKDADEAETRLREYRLLLNRGIHVGNFIRWVEGGNA